MPRSNEARPDFDDGTRPRFSLFAHHETSGFLDNYCSSFIYLWRLRRRLTACRARAFRMQIRLIRRLRTQPLGRRLQLRSSRFFQEALSLMARHPLLPIHHQRMEPLHAAGEPLTLD